MTDTKTRELQEPSSRAILAAHREPSDDLAAERQRVTFNVTELCYAMNDGREKFERKNELADTLSQTEWGDKSRRYFYTREEEYISGLKAALGIWEMMKSKQLSLEEAHWARELVNLPGGLLLHIGMFIPSLMSQGSPEQQEKWLPLSYKLAVIGSYAQTELGHGTFVRGLETTATYDPAAQEFILHSPTLSATKWWPGGLGRTCSHCITMARLFINGKDYGPHGFITQLRDMENHRPLRGITLGDIGPKFGINGVDNGFLSFDHVRIPRDHMLMRYAKVLPDGTYVPPPASNSKASYATMLFVRADIIMGAGKVLGAAATIATRYCAVRRQTAVKPGQLETQVLDYQNVQHTLLPLVAASYALRFLGKKMEEQYYKFEDDREKGDFSALPELHASSSGLKALSTWITTEGIEACRATCGGHGYSHLSGLPSLLQNYAPNITWEGENNVLCLQTARFVLKSLVAAQRSGAKPPGSCAYLADAPRIMADRCQVVLEACWDDPQNQLAALHHIATRLAMSTAAAILSEAGGKMQFDGPIWSSQAVNLVRTAKAHCWTIVHVVMVESICKLESSGEVGPATAAVLRKLASLNTLAYLERSLGDLLEDGYVNGAQAAKLRQRARQLLTELRPNAVGLVDALGYHDYMLNSALGRKDGDVYRAMLKMAQGSPLNDTVEGPGWHSVMKPVMLAARSKM